jgi:hypothetical protein
MRLNQLRSCERHPSRARHIGMVIAREHIEKALGVVRAKIHLDMNVSRAFTLNPKDKDHPRTLTFNARSANLLNHTNVTAVGTVVSSSNFGQSISAETARRVDFGLRFAF